MPGTPFTFKYKPVAGSTEYPTISNSVAFFILSCGITPSQVTSKEGNISKLLFSAIALNTKLLFRTSLKFSGKGCEFISLLSSFFSLRIIGFSFSVSGSFFVCFLEFTFVSFTFVFVFSFSEGFILSDDKNHKRFCWLSIRALYLFSSILKMLLNISFKASEIISQMFL